MYKTLILLAALTVATAGTTFAQTAPAKASTATKSKAKKSPEQKADHKAGKMAKELGLTADQEARVEQLLLARQQEKAAFKTKYGANKTAGRTEMKAAHDRHEAQLKTILTAEQYTRFTQLKAEDKSHSKAKDGNKAKGKAKA